MQLTGVPGTSSEPCELVLVRRVTVHGAVEFPERCSYESSVLVTPVCFVPSSGGPGDDQSCW